MTLIKTWDITVMHLVFFGKTGVTLSLNPAKTRVLSGPSETILQLNIQNPKHYGVQFFSSI
jgi:hypothetical protein